MQFCRCILRWPSIACELVVICDVQEREAAESAERGRGAAVIAAQLVERQEARLAAEVALKQVRSCCCACITTVSRTLPVLDSVGEQQGAGSCVQQPSGCPHITSSNETGCRHDVHPPLDTKMRRRAKQ